MDIAGLNFKNSFVLTLVIEERVSWMVDIHYIVMWSRSPRSPHTTKYEFLMIHSLSLLWLAGQSQVIAKVSNPTVQHFSTYSTHHTGQIWISLNSWVAQVQWRGRVPDCIIMIETEGNMMKYSSDSLRVRESQCSEDSAVQCVREGGREGLRQLTISASVPQSKCGPQPSEISAGHQVILENFNLKTWPNLTDWLAGRRAGDSKPRPYKLYLNILLATCFLSVSRQQTRCSLYIS